MKNLFQTSCRPGIYALLALMLLFRSSGMYAAKDSSSRYIKLDLAPLYSVFFDVRKQARIGLEYQWGMERRSFYGIHADGGIYDDYNFYKYYDFFNTGEGFRYMLRNVKTYGFHVLPAWHYRLTRNTEKKLTYHAGLTADINVFQKRIRTFNSMTLEKSSELQEQGRIGLGPHIAMNWRIKGNWHLELKAVLIANMITLHSQPDMKNIKPFKSVWFDERQRLWFIPHINICYAL